MNLEIRQEQDDDFAGITNVIRKAFTQSPYGLSDEDRIVENLRADGALTISLVALADEEVVGHVAVSPVRINDDPQIDSPGWFGLGPVAVRPDFQRRSIGRVLIIEALMQLHEKQAGGCVVLGDPNYYTRFGFTRVENLILPDVPQEYFLARPLHSTPPQGNVVFHPAFSPKKE